MRNHAIMAALLISASARADPVVVERLVARVDGRPVFLSEIRQQARVSLATQTPAQRGTNYRRTYRQLLRQRIERELISVHAERQGTFVTGAEIDHALEAVAKANGLDMDALFAHAFRVGLDREDYRDEIRQQLLEQRVSYAFGLRVLGTYPETEPARAEWLTRARTRLIAEARRQTCIERWARW